MPMQCFCNFDFLTFKIRSVALKSVSYTFTAIYKIRVSGGHFRGLPVWM